MALELALDMVVEQVQVCIELDSIELELELVQVVELVCIHELVPALALDIVVELAQAQALDIAVELVQVLVQDMALVE